MRFIWGLLFLAWGSSIIFNFDFHFGKYILPLIVIGIGINIIIGKNSCCSDKEFRRKAKRERKDEKYRNKTEGDHYDK